jgi:hypothetical protein
VGSACEDVGVWRALRYLCLPKPERFTTRTSYIIYANQKGNNFTLAQFRLHECSIYVT